MNMNTPKITPKGEADSYIRQCIPENATAAQVVEIRLALYAGMLSGINLMTELPDRKTEKMTIEDITTVHNEIAARALRLNAERQKLPTPYGK